ncbi:MAG: hypothetical protein PHC53_01785 [Patescibacteria group bacterium]|nr:hypothetical protein [Patescibacteria group bacterium]
MAKKKKKKTDDDGDKLVSWITPEELEAYSAELRKRPWGRTTKPGERFEETLFPDSPSMRLTVVD